MSRAENDYSYILTTCKLSFMKIELV